MDNNYVYNAFYCSGWLLEARNKNDGTMATSKFWNGRWWPNNIFDIEVDASGNVYTVERVSGVFRIQKLVPSCDVPTDVDCGLRFYDGIQNVSVACEPLGTLTSPLRISKGADTYGVVLVDTTDSSASKIRVQTASGIKALKKL